MDNSNNGLIDPKTGFIKPVVDKIPNQIVRNEAEAMADRMASDAINNMANKAYSPKISAVGGESVKDINPASPNPTISTPERVALNRKKMPDVISSIRRATSASVSAEGNPALSYNKEAAEKYSEKGVFGTPKKISLESAYDIIGGTALPKYPSYTPGLNNEELAASRQTTGEKWLNGFSKLAIKTGLYGVSGVASIPAGLIGWASKGSFSGVYDNAFSKWVNEIDERINHNFAFYYKQEEKDMNFFQKMGTANFWANDLIGDGLSFTTGAMLSAFLTGGMGVSSLGSAGARIGMRTAAKMSSRKLASAAVKSSFNKLKRGAVVGSAIGNSAKTLAYMGVGAGWESSVEANSMLKEARDGYKQYIREMYGREATSQEMADFNKSIEGTANTVFAANMGIVGLSNFMLLGKYVGLNSKFASRFIPGTKGISRTKGLAKRYLFGVGAKRSKDEAGKLVATKSNLLQRIARRTWVLSKAPLSEGVFEEGLQGVAQRAADDYIKSRYDKNYIRQAVGVWDAIGKGMKEQYSSKEGWNEIGMGAMIGSLFGIMPAIRGRGSEKRMSAMVDAYNKNNAFSLTSVKDVMRNTVLLGHQMREHDGVAMQGRVEAGIDSTEYEKFALSDRMGLLDSNAQDFISMVEGLDESELASQYSMDEGSAREYKAGIIADYKRKLESYKKATSFADALLTDTANEDQRAYVEQVAYKGLVSGMAVNEFAEDINDAISRDDSIGEGLKVYSNLKKETIEKAREINMMAGRIKKLEERIRKHATSTTRVNEEGVDTEAEAIRKETEELEKLRSKYNDAMEALGNLTVSDYNDMEFVDSVRSLTTGIPTAEQVLAAYDAVSSVDYYLKGIKGRDMTETEKTLNDLIIKYRNSVVDYKNFANLINKMQDEKFMSSHLKGLTAAIRKATTTEGIDLGEERTELTDSQRDVDSHIDEALKSGRMSEEEAYTAKIFNHLRDGIKAEEEGEPVEVVSDEEYDNIVNRGYVGDNEFAVLNVIASKVRESGIESLTDREKAVYNKEKGTIDYLGRLGEGDTLDSMMKDLKDSVKKYLDPENLKESNKNVVDAVRETLDEDEQNQLDEAIDQYKDVLLNGEQEDGPTEMELEDTINEIGQNSEFGMNLAPFVKQNTLLDTRGDDSSVDTETGYGTTDRQISELNNEKDEDSSKSVNVDNAQNPVVLMTRLNKEGDYEFFNLRMDRFFDYLKSIGAAISSIEMGRDLGITLSTGENVKIIASKNHARFVVTKEDLNKIIQASGLSIPGNPVDYTVVYRRDADGYVSPLYTNNGYGENGTDFIDQEAVARQQEGAPVVFVMDKNDAYNKKLWDTYQADPSEKNKKAFVNGAVVKIMSEDGEFLSVLRSGTDKLTTAVRGMIFDSYQGDGDTVQLGTGKIVKVYPGRPVFSFSEDGSVSPHDLSDQELDRIVDVGYISNGEVYLKNGTKDYSAFPYTSKIIKGRNKLPGDGGYKNVRIPVVVIKGRTGLNYVYPVSLKKKEGADMDISALDDLIIDIQGGYQYMTEYERMETIDKINTYIVEAGLDYSEYAIPVSGSLEAIESAVFKLEPVLREINGYANVLSWEKDSRSARDIARDDIQVNMQMSDNMFVAPKIRISIDEAEDEPVSTMEDDYEEMPFGNDSKPVKVIETETPVEPAQTEPAPVEPTPTEPEKKGYNTVGALVAAEYLLSASGVIESADYLMKAISGVFMKSTQEIENLRVKYFSELSKFADVTEFSKSELYNTIMDEISDILYIDYGLPAVSWVLDKIKENPTGLPGRMGSYVSRMMEAIEGGDDASSFVWEGETSTTEKEAPKGEPVTEQVKPEEKKKRTSSKKNYSNLFKFLDKTEVKDIADFLCRAIGRGELKFLRNRNNPKDITTLMGVRDDTKKVQRIADSKGKNTDEYIDWLKEQAATSSIVSEYLKDRTDDMILADLKYLLGIINMKQSGAVQYVISLHPEAGVEDLKQGLSEEEKASIYNHINGIIKDNTGEELEVEAIAEDTLDVIAGKADDETVTEETEQAPSDKEDPEKALVEKSLEVYPDKKDADKTDEEPKVEPKADKEEKTEPEKDQAKKTGGETKKVKELVKEMKTFLDIDDMPLYAIAYYIINGIKAFKSGKSPLSRIIDLASEYVTDIKGFMGLFRILESNGMSIDKNLRNSAILGVISNRFEDKNIEKLYKASYTGEKEYNEKKEAFKKIVQSMNWSISDYDIILKNMPERVGIMNDIMREAADNNLGEFDSPMDALNFVFDYFKSERDRLASESKGKTEEKTPVRKKTSSKKGSSLKRNTIAVEVPARIEKFAQKIVDEIGGVDYPVAVKIAEEVMGKKNQINSGSVSPFNIGVKIGVWFNDTPRIVKFLKLIKSKKIDISQDMINGVLYSIAKDRIKDAYFISLLASSRNEINFENAKDSYLETIRRVNGKDADKYEEVISFYSSQKDSVSELMKEFKKEGLDKLGDTSAFEKVIDFIISANQNELKNMTSVEDKVQETGTEQRTVFSEEDKGILSDILKGTESVIDRVISAIEGYLEGRDEKTGLAWMLGKWTGSLEKSKEIINTFFSKGKTNPDTVIDLDGADSSLVQSIEKGISSSAVVKVLKGDVESEPDTLHRMAPAESVVEEKPFNLETDDRLSDDVKKRLGPIIPELTKGGRTVDFNIIADAIVKYQSGGKSRKMSLAIALGRGTGNFSKTKMIIETLFSKDVKGIKKEDVIDLNGKDADLIFWINTGIDAYGKPVKKGVRFRMASKSSAQIPIRKESDVKAAQLGVIQKTNPMLDDIHTGVRSVDDILTFKEAMGNETYTPDYTRSDADNALKSGKVTVYSSQPIENGAFVTPSKMEAESYAGGGKVYSKEVNLDDVAWIDTVEGQYASVSDKDIARASEKRIENRDREYVKAIEKGDTEKAKAMVAEAANEAGYISGVGYRILHRAPSAKYGTPATNITDIFPEDIFSENGAFYYGDGDRYESQMAIDKIKSIQGNPDAKITVYRAIPKNIREGSVRNGDWVTLSERYAKEHGFRNYGGGGYRIIKQEVRAGDLYNDGNSIFEFGYDDTRDYGYQNTKNNRKLLDVATYDDNGNLIPLSKRFNLRSSDVRFRTSGELFEEYPTWLSGQTTSTGQHSTQITSTVNTYKKIGGWMEENGMEGASVLDASSGLGKGTEALRGMGFNVDDVEPYPSENREAPTYSRYEDVDKKYDVVISNAVLNVIPDDWRRDVLLSMADKVKKGGKMIINVRDAKDIEKQKQKIELDSPSEILVTDKKGNIRAYQKGFTQQELIDWVKSELGPGWKVETANKSNSGITGRAVVVTRIEDETPLEYRDLSEAAADTRFRFIGEQGAARLDAAEEATIRMDNLNVAREMETVGKDAKTIKMATGWERGADKKWRYETQDFEEFDESGNIQWKKDHPRFVRFLELNRKLNESAFLGGEKLTEEEKEEYRILRKEHKHISSNRPQAGRDNLTLSDFIEDDNLFNAYPDLKTMPVRFEKLGEGVRGAFVSSVLSGDHIAINSVIFDAATSGNVAMRRTMESTLNHEIQHAIQAQEGFSSGGNAKNVRGALRTKKDTYLNKLKSMNLLKRRLDYYKKQRQKLEEAKEWIENPESFIGSPSSELIRSESREDIIKEGQEFAEKHYWNARFSLEGILSENDIDSVSLKSMDDELDNDELFSRLAREGDSYEEMMRGFDEAIKKTEKELRNSIVSDSDRSRLDKLKSILSDKSSFELYEALAGEVEARNVQERMGMTAEERRESLASETEDVAREDQIFMEESLGVMDNAVQEVQDAETAVKLAETLNTEIEVINNISEIEESDPELLSQKQRAKGWYDVETGKIYLVMPNIDNAADAQATILHEVVVHKGLRGLFGDKFESEMRRIYNNLSDEARSIIDAAAESDYDGDKLIATEEYLAEVAESGVEAPGLWSMIVSAIKNFFRNMGLNISISSDDVSYMLWKSKQNLMNSESRQKAVFPGVDTVIGENQHIMAVDGLMDSGLNKEEAEEVLRDTIDEFNNIKEKVAIKDITERYYDTEGQGAVPGAAEEKPGEEVSGEKITGTEPVGTGTSGVDADIRGAGRAVGTDRNVISRSLSDRKNMINIVRKSNMTSARRETERPCPVIKKGKMK